MKLITAMSLVSESQPFIDDSLTLALLHKASWLPVAASTLCLFQPHQCLPASASQGHFKNWKRPMAFSQAERERIEATLAQFLDRERPPVKVRSQLDYAFAIAATSVELHEVRPRWDDPTQKMIRPFARATYAKTRDRWRIDWVRSDLKWHRYDPEPVVASLERFLAVVQEDAHACFHG